MTWLIYSFDSLVLTLRHFQKVITELGFHWSLNFVNGCAEDDFVVLRDHLSGTKGTQLATVAAGRALGVLLRQLTEIGTAIYLRVNIIEICIPFLLYVTCV